MRNEIKTVITLLYEIEKKVWEYHSKAIGKYAPYAGDRVEKLTEELEAISAAIEILSEIE